MAGSSDILMMLIKTGSSSGMPAEGQTMLNRADNMLTLPGKPAFKHGEFFELESFSLTHSSPSQDATTDGNKNITVKVEGGDKKGSPGVGSATRTGRDTKWLPGHLQQVTCVRQLDLASSELFAQVGKDAAFASAAIVRRKIVGGLPSADGNLMGYFRLDFKEVTITEVGWSADEDGVKETLMFVCKTAEVVYRQQSHTGEMTKIFPPGKWP
jgi:type VI protein secretion system component Hcp